jgi:hypothetical protein
MKSILVVSKPFDSYAIGSTIDDPITIADILASTNADKVRKMEVEMQPILRVLQPFDTYTIGWIINDPESIAHVLTSGNADKVQKAEMMTSAESEKWYRQLTIDKALAVNLADGVFIIVFYNSQFSNKAPEKRINPFEVFATASKSEIQEWIERSKRLMSSNYPVGDAIVDKSSEYEKIRDDYINNNPGFSIETYSHAIHLGASKACH